MGVLRDYDFKSDYFELISDSLRSVHTDIFDHCTMPVTATVNQKKLQSSYVLPGF